MEYIVPSNLSENGGVPTPDPMGEERQSFLASPGRAVPAHRSRNPPQGSPRLVLPGARVISFDRAQAPEGPQGNLGPQGSVVAGVAEDEEWVTPFRRHRRADNFDKRSYVIWGIPQDISNATVLLTICKPRGPLPPNMVSGIDSRTKRVPQSANDSDSRPSSSEDGSPPAPIERRQTYRYIHMRKPNNLEALQSPHQYAALKQVCEARGWRAVRSRTYGRRQADRYESSPEDVYEVPAEPDENPYAPLQGEGGQPGPVENLASAIPAPTPEVPHHLQMGSLNVTGGLPHKIAELERYFLQHNYHVIALSEVRKCKELTVQGYEYYSSNDLAESGGVGFLVARALKSFVTVVDGSSRNQLWIRIAGSNGKKDLYLCSAYMPQESDSALKRQEAWNALSERVISFQALGEVVVAGDLNAKLGPSQTAAEHKFTGTFSGGSRSQNGRLLMQLLERTSMANVAGFARPPSSVGGSWYTRTASHGDSRSQIDYILVPLGQRQSHRSRFMVDYTSLDTDHHLLHARIFSPRRFNSNRRHRVYKRHAIEKLRVKGATKYDEVDAAGNVLPDDPSVRMYRECLTEAFADYTPGEGIDLGGEMAEEVLADFLQRLKKALDDSVGTKSISKRFSRSWYDAEVKRAVHKRRAALSSYRRNRCSPMWQKYKDARLQVREVIKAKKRDAWVRINKSVTRDRIKDPARMWKTLRRIMAQSKSSGASTPVFRPDRTIAESPSDRREAWAAYEEALGKPPNEDSFDEAHRVNTVARIEEIESIEDVGIQEDLNRPFTVEEIVAGKKKLQSGKASGLDQISCEALRAGGEVLDEAVLKLFNWFNQHEDPPQDWAKALTVYLYKAGDPRECSNYRGISLISCLGKWYLSIWSQRIQNKVNPSLEESQHGFRPGRSTTDPAFVLNETLVRRKRAGLHTYCLFIDFHKAFDKVWHEGLWVTLYDMGIRGKVWRIFKKLYSKMQSSVLIEGEASRAVDKKVGVRQGCPASPLLFNIFINGLARKLQESQIGVHLDFEDLCALLFADDVALLAGSPHELQQLIDIVATYCGTWRLTVNMQKSKILAVRGGMTSRVPPFSCTYNGEVLGQVSEYEYLGLTFQSNLHWSSHVKKLLAKGAQTLTALQRIFRQRSIPLTLKRQLWISLCRSKLEYGSQIWTPYSDSSAHALEALQHKACIHILRVNEHSSALALRAVLGLPSLEARRSELRLRYMEALHRMPENRLPAKAYRDCERTCSRTNVQDTFYHKMAELRHQHPALEEGWARVLELEEEEDSGWRQDIKKWMNSVLHGDITHKVHSKESSTARLLAQCPHDAFSVERPFPIVEMTPSHINFIRIRLLSGTHSLNSMMQRITKGHVNRRTHTCQACNSEEEETISHFLRSCNSERARAARAIHEDLVGEGFATLTDDEKCIFILGGCRSGSKSALKPTREQDAANCELLRALWVARNDTFEQAEVEPDQVVAGDAAQPLIGQFFAAVPPQEAPANIDPAQVIAGDAAQPLIGQFVAAVPPQEAPANIDPARVVAGDASQPLIGQFFAAIPPQEAPANIDPAQVVAGDAAQPQIGQFFAAVSPQEAPANIDPAQVVAGDAAQPLIGQFFAAVPPQEAPANIDHAQVVAGEAAQPLEGQMFVDAPPLSPSSSLSSELHLPQGNRRNSDSEVTSESETEIMDEDNHRANHLMDLESVIPAEFGDVSPHHGDDAYLGEDEESSSDDSAPHHQGYVPRCNSWERLEADFNPQESRLTPIGLADESISERHPSAEASHASDLESLSDDSYSSQSSIPSCFSIDEEDIRAHSINRQLRSRTPRHYPRHPNISINPFTPNNNQAILARPTGGMEAHVFDTPR